MRLRSCRQTLGGLSAQQLKIDAMRADERQIFARSNEDLEQGIAGVQVMSILREYYGPSFVQQPNAQSSGGAGSPIIEILEVIESDSSKNLAELSLSEAEAESSY